MVKDTISKLGGPANAFTTSKLGGSANDFATSKLGQGIASGLGGMTSGLSALNTTGNSTAIGVRDSINSAMLQSGNPYVMAAGAINSIFDAAGDIGGFNLNNMNRQDLETLGGQGIDSVVNNAIQGIPLIGTLAGALSSKTNKMSQNLNNFGMSTVPGYNASWNQIKAANNLSNKNFLTGKSTINKGIGLASNSASFMNDIGRSTTLRLNSNYSLDLAQQNQNRLSKPQTISFSKSGSKLLSREELQKILNSSKVKQFQNGGVIGTDSNLIPEGHLHAHLNHLQDKNPDLEDTTKKGIPVMTQNKDGELEQIAEVECGELILRLEVTKKLEDLMEDGSAEAMIEAGKLLTTELITNTEDNTQQLNLIENV